MTKKDLIMVAHRIHNAAFHGDMKTVKEQLNKGVNVNIQHKDYKQTALHCAASRAHVDIVKLLAEAKATIDAVNSIGESPLMYASASGHVNSMEYLLDQKADINKASNAGMTALMFAAQSGKEDAVKVLL